MPESSDQDRSAFGMTFRILSRCGGACQSSRTRFRQSIACLYFVAIGIASAGRPVGAQDVPDTTALSGPATSAAAPLPEVSERRAELEREIGKLEDRFLQLEKTNQELKASNEQLRQKLRVAAVAGKGFSRSLARRTFSRVSRHIAAAGGAAVPYVGAGVLSGMVRLDVRDGCETLEELNDLNRALDLDAVETSRVCVMQVPSGEQILAQVLANWRTAYAISAAWTNQYQAVLPPEPPVVPHAGAYELWMAVFGPNPTVIAPVSPKGTTSPTAPVPPTPPAPPGIRLP
jgi:hypothetical protein